MYTYVYIYIFICLYIPVYILYKNHYVNDNINFNEYNMILKLSDIFFVCCKVPEDLCAQALPELRAKTHPNLVRRFWRVHCWKLHLRLAVKSDLVQETCNQSLTGSEHIFRLKKCVWSSQSNVRVWCPLHSPRTGAKANTSTHGVLLYLAPTSFEAGSDPGATAASSISISRSLWIPCRKSTKSIYRNLTSLQTIYPYILSTCVQARLLAAWRRMT